MRLLTYVHSGEFAEATPQYALIEIKDAGPLRTRIDAIADMARAFGYHSELRASGEVFSVLFWAGLLPIEVTWLHYGALLDADGAEPEWIHDLQEVNMVVPPEDWEPTVADADGSNVFYECDLMKLEIYPDGTMDVQANVFGGSETIETQEFKLEDFES